MTNAVVALPTSGDSESWTASESALVEAAGLVYSERRGGPKMLAERPVVEAFLLHCRRTGLDPIARQIYAIRRAGKWQTQVSIDGARLVAERTGEYEGQTAPEWSNDGVTWSEAWMGSAEQDHPLFARVGVYRRGHRDAMRVVARWDSYAVYDDVWERGQKTGEKRVSSMWGKMPDLMLAKVAEMLALRKAFPQDLSGLYSSEEMAQADRPQRAEQAAPVAQQPLVADAVEPAEDWFAAAAAVSSKDEANALWRRIAKHERTPEVRAAIEARLAALAEAEKPSEPEAAPQWAEQQAPVEDWAVAEVPQPDDDVETVDGVLEGTEVEQAAPSSGYDR